jgi:putative heme-binding domain-containing protein
MSQRKPSLKPSLIALILLAGLWSVWSAPGAHAKPFQILDGDRIVLIGDTLIEREQEYGCLEALMNSCFSERHFIVRNLGWSGDTPAGISRASFDFATPEKGFDLLKAELAVIKPTVAMIGYGMASSFDGPDGLPKFHSEMEKLMDAVQASAGGTKVRFVLLSPIPHERLPAPLPDPTAHNESLRLYTQAIADLAAKRDASFVDLNSLLQQTNLTDHALTDDGIHLTDYGYVRMAEAVGTALGFFNSADNQLNVLFTLFPPGPSWSALSPLVSPVVARGGVLAYPLKSPLKRFFSGSKPLPPGRYALKLGRYALKVDGQVVAIATNQDWESGVPIDRGPDVERAEQLRQSIIAKNKLFFDRWRPENETYLFGFRKHEQGQNGKEIPMFDPLIKEAEDKIEQLRQPVKRQYEMVEAGNLQLPPASVPKPEVSVFNAPPTAIPQLDIAPGFEVTLYAENPQLAKPIQMNFDPEGRLWIATSEVYPQIKPNQEANDKILLLEDTKGVGKIDKSTVFAEGLLIPTGIEPGDGGCYVGQSTELLHFKDTTGDGRADERRVVLSGFGTEDTHHILHTLRWGFDGQLYFNQSIYIHSHLETPNGVVRLNSGGVFNLRPRSMQLEVFLRGFCNPWGHQFDEFGQSFETDGAGGEGVAWGLRDATYFTYAQMRREMQSVSPGSYPKFASLEIIYSRQFPDDWQGNMITCDFRAHRVVRFAASEDGAGYVTKELPDFIRSSDVTFRPIDVKLGPDGALYIADWSNPIIQHGEVDFRDPRRDKEHGRIWRVAAKGRPALPRINFRHLANPELLDYLLSPNAYERQQSRRVLTERGDSIRGVLAEWTARQTDEKALMQALWMHQAIDWVEPGLLRAVLAAKDGRIRAAGVRVLSFWQDRIGQPLDLLAQLVQDEHPRVRVEAARALAKVPSERAAELVLGAVDRPMDPFLDYALWLSINDLAQPWIDAVKAGRWKIEGREKQLEFALSSIQPELAATVLNQLLGNKPLPRDGSGPWIDLVGKAGRAAELQAMFQQVLDGGFEPAGAAKALAALAEAGRLRAIKPGGDLSQVQKLLADPRDDVRLSAVQLAGLWKVASLLPDLLTSASGPAPALRRAALESVREIGGRSAIDGLREMAGQGTPPEIRAPAAVALASLDLRRSSSDIAAALGSVQDEPGALAAWRGVLEVRGAAQAMTAALPKAEVTQVSARAGLRAAREGGRSEPDLILALARAGKLEDDSQQLSDAELARIAADAKKGDPARGEIVYRRQTSGCVACHSIGGVGGKVGPDLTSIGASAQMDYLVESVFFPNRKIKEGYHAVLVQTKDGDDYSGILVRENVTELVLRDASNKEISIPKNRIQSRTMGGSLMPAGLLGLLRADERDNLFRFLSELGKPGFDASRGNVARSWSVFPATIASEQFGEDRFARADFTIPGWVKVSSLVNGRLPASELQLQVDTYGQKNPQAVFAAARFQTAKAGPVSLKLDLPDSATVWVDGKKEATASTVTADLPLGPHTLVIKLEGGKLPGHIRAETADATFLTE